MTDNEIKKALECCADEMGCKKGCPCFDPKAKGSCCTISKIGIEKIALDLINRQQAEIERLQNTLDDILDRQPILVAMAEKYAIEEFAEQLIEKHSWDVPYETEDAHYVQVVCVGDIEDFVKEKVGEDNG